MTNTHRLAIEHLTPEDTVEGVEGVIGDESGKALVELNEYFRYTVDKGVKNILPSPGWCLRFKRHLVTRDDGWGLSSIAPIRHQQMHTRQVYTYRDVPVRLRCKYRDRRRGFNWSITRMRTWAILSE